MHSITYRNGVSTSLKIANNAYTPTGRNCLPQKKKSSVENPIPQSFLQIY